VINQAQSFIGPDATQRARDAADTTVSTLATGSWWLFIGALLSMVVGMMSGAMGARSLSRRRANRGYPVPA
jgi:hypothetical protein